MLRACVLLAMLAGCDQLFGLDEIVPAPSDAAFVVERCPTSYDRTLSSASRHRFTQLARTAWENFDDCAADMPGWTHLVVISERTRASSSRRSSITDPTCAPTWA